MESARTIDGDEEERRLAALRGYEVLDTAPEEALDDLAALAAHICGSELAAISLVDRRREWFKARIGFEVAELPREVSFCDHALELNDVLVVPDATKDARFAQNPLVTGEPHVRFYAGAPLITPEGLVLGTLCVIDRVPRDLNERQKQALRVLSRQVMTQFQLRQRSLALAKNERLLRGILEAEPECLHVLDEKGRLQMINRAGLSILEADSLEQLDGQSIFPLVAAEDREAYEALMKRVFRGEAGILEFRATGLKGTARWLETHAAPQRDETGEVIAVLGITRDITEQKQAVDELKASEARYRALFEYAPEGILIIGPEDRYLDANASACRLLGYTREEILRLTPPDLVAETELKYVGPAIETVKTGRNYHRESRFKRKDGQNFDVDLIGTLTPDGHILAMFRDITEKKRSESRFHRVIDSSAQGVVLWGEGGLITGANECFLRMMGYTREDLDAGLINWITMTPLEYAETDRLAVEDIFATGKSKTYEKEYFRKDGSRVPVLISPSSFDDTPRGGVCFVLDLTERKKLEQQFLRAQRMESIGTLAGGIAHDLNNTLGPIITGLELLQLRFPDSDSRELLAIIGASAHRGADMVSQVLAYARGMEGRRMEVQVKYLMQDVGKIARDTFRKNIEVRVLLPKEDLKTIRGDPTQLHQVLLNLCVNARDAMPEGGLLTMKAKNLNLDAHYAGLDLEAQPGPYIQMQVTDTGSGMAAELLEKIFDPFFTTKEIGKGTGLGLSTSMGIVKSHGGFIRVQSEVGTGTEFTVFLPAQAEPPTAAATPVTELPSGHGELILVVDDEEAARQITRQTLEAFGYRVLLASDGAEALALFGRRSGEIAAVLTDMMMPIMDGPATIQVLRKMNPKVRIIGASGLSLSDHVARASNLGVTFFLPKPYTAESLLKILRRVLEAET